MAPKRKFGLLLVTALIGFTLSLLTAGPSAVAATVPASASPPMVIAAEADAGTNDVLLEFDQPLLGTPAGIPPTNRFTVTVDGVARNTTGIAIFNDSPPLDSLVDISFDGLPLVTGQTVCVTYREPLPGQPRLQDPAGNPVLSFGPICVPAS